MTLRLVMKCVALCAVLTAGGAHAMVLAYSGSSYGSGSSYEGQCTGRLIAMTNRVADACRPIPRGLGASHYMVMGGWMCQSCENLGDGDMCTSIAETKAAMAEVMARRMVLGLSPFTARWLEGWLLDIFVHRCEEART